MERMYFILAITALLITLAIGGTPANSTAANYDPAELLMKNFNTKDTMLPRANYDFTQFGGEIFEAQNDLEHNNIRYDVKFDGDLYAPTHDKYEPTYDTNVQNDLQGVVKFEEGNNNGSNKKKRRKRKPRQHYGLQNPAIAPNLPYGDGQIPYPYFGGQYYRPPRPTPSLASEALSAVTGALTSIALYDDYQCVPRLLCEAAAGGALGSSGILQSVSGLQPLLTLLSAYNGIASNPLFVFGRAVFLGVSSNGNSASCRYAYSYCPTDPEQLVHYLNNHNGGFFRFFNAPQHPQYGQQNVEQFYNQLSQNYGLYQPQQNYNQNVDQLNYGPHNSLGQQNYGFYKPGLNTDQDTHNYGLAYPYYSGGQNIRFKNSDNFNDSTNKIEKRIQNKPSTFYIDDLEDINPTWTFPDASENTRVNYVNNVVFNANSITNDDDVNNNENRFNYNDSRKGKTLKFPVADIDEDYLKDNYDRRVREFHFPGHQNNRQYLDYNYRPANHYFENENVNDHVYVTQYDVNNKKYNYNRNDNNDVQDGLRTVYVVRGNGDPNKPEIYKLRPGQTVQ